MCGPSFTEYKPHNVRDKMNQLVLSWFDYQKFEGCIQSSKMKKQKFILLETNSNATAEKK